MSAPTVLRLRGYRFFFYSNDGVEPPHVHVDREKYSAKFWLEPIVLADNLGYSSKELRDIQRLIAQNHRALVEAWHAYFRT